MGVKRPHAEMVADASADIPAKSPLLSMFEMFKAELDEHYDRRERVIRASRDMTAASKKIIFALQRVRHVGQSVPESIAKSNVPHFDTIASQVSIASPDLQGLNAYRYAKNISGGCQEYVEAVSFGHYLATGRLMTLEESIKSLQNLNNSPFQFCLSETDYLLGIYDMTGELMRFAITTIATNGNIPEVPTASGEERRSLLSDLRELRQHLEYLRIAHGPLASESSKKSSVMRQSVEKVERALYGLIVRGAERPNGWNPAEDNGAVVVD